MGWVIQGIVGNTRINGMLYEECCIAMACVGNHPPGLAFTDHPPSPSPSHTLSKKNIQQLSLQYSFGIISACYLVSSHGHKLYTTLTRSLV